MWVLEALVSLIGDANLVVQVSMERFEVGRHKMVFMRGDVGEGDREARVVAFVRKEGRSSRRGVRGIVAHEFSEGQLGRPVVLLIVDENPEVLLESLIRSLRLAVGFGVVGGREVRGDVERLTERLPEVRDEEVASVGDDVGRETVLREYVLNELAGELRG